MKILFALGLLTATLLQANAATYLLLTQTNALAAGITNQAKAYTDAHNATNAANWVASGTTGSGLAGQASVGSLISTTNITITDPANGLGTLRSPERLTLETDWDTNSAAVYRYIDLKSRGTTLMTVGLDTNVTIFGQAGAPALTINGSQVITNSSTSTTPLTINHASGATVPATVWNTGEQTNAVIGPNGMVASRKMFQQYQGTLTHAGTTTLDFDGTTTDNSMTITGAVTLATSNLATNRNYSLTLYWPGVTNAPLTTPAWLWQGFAPTNLWPTNKTFTILLNARGANDTNVLAYFGGQL